MNALSRNAILMNIARNPEARPPGHPEADQMFFRDGVHEYRWSCDDNGMLLPAQLRIELEKVVACALTGGGHAAIIAHCGTALTVNLNVAGYGGRARWASPTTPNVRGGYLFLAQNAQVAAASMPAPVDYLDRSKIEIYEPVKTVFQRRVHHHRAPDQHIDVMPTHERPLTFFGMRVRG